MQPYVCSVMQTKMSLPGSKKSIEDRGIATKEENKQTLIHKGSRKAEGARRECIETSDVSLPRAEPAENYACAVPLEEAEDGDGEAIVAGNGDVDLGHIPVCKIVE